MESSMVRSCMENYCRDYEAFFRVSCGLEYKPTSDDYYKCKEDVLNFEEDCYAYAKQAYYAGERVTDF